MVQIQGRSCTFFRLNPAGQGKPQCFAVRRGEIKDKALACGPYAVALLILLENWAQAKLCKGVLSDWADVNPRTDTSFLKSGDIVSFIPMEAVEEVTGRIHLQEADYGKVSKGYTLFAENDIIWAKITPCMQNGKSAVARGLLNGIGFGSTEFHVLRPKTDQLLPDFLWAVLSTNSLLRAAQGAFSGSAGQQRVPPGFLENLPLPVPSPGVQRKLVTELLTTRGSRDAKLAQAEMLLNGIDDLVLGELGVHIPQESDRFTFAVRRGDIIGKPLQCNRSSLFVRAFLSSLAQSPYASSSLMTRIEVNPRTDVSFLRRGDVVSFIPMEAVSEDGKGLTIQESTYEDVAKRYTVFAEGDLLWAKITPCMQNGKTSVARGLVNGVGFGSTEFHVLRPINEEVNIDYLCTFFSLNCLRSAAQGAFTGAAGQQRVPESFIKNLPLPLPDIKIQERIANDVLSRHKKASILRNEATSSWAKALEDFEGELLAKGGEA